MAGQPGYIFNLGHGIRPAARPESVGAVAADFTQRGLPIERKNARAGCRHRCGITVASAREQNDGNFGFQFVEQIAHPT
ncbi:MAG: hypothetical protein ACKOB0_01070 [Chthoniobacterales bacterium]